jgi:hypothetical protein
MHHRRATLKKSGRAALIALAPCCALIALSISCGGTDYIDDPNAADGASADGPNGRIDGAGNGDGNTSSDGTVADGALADGALADGALADADAALVDADAALPPSNVPLLRTAATFAVLGGQAVTSSGTTTIFGNVGVSPKSALTGLPPGQPVGGAIYLGNDAVVVQAQKDLTTLYDDLKIRPCTTILTGQDLKGMKLLPGVYCFASSAALGAGAPLTLDANNEANAFWVFQIDSTLDVDGTVLVINGGTACNAFWQVGSSATVNNNAAFAGNIVAFTSITLNTLASVAPGRALARNAAVTMLSNNVSTALCP